MMDAWYGTEQSFREIERLLNSGAQLRSSDLDEFGKNPVATSVVNGLGIMEVKGGLVTSSNWLTRFFGIASYDDVKSAAADLAGNGDVKTILAVYDSPGGSAEGCKSCATFLREINDKHKPLVSFTNNYATSAAYWLYSAGQMRIVGEDGRLGSVGAIIVHTEYSEQDKQRGITRTVLRSAPYKALGTPYERLSDEAKNELEEELEFLHNSFVSGIASLTGISERKVRTDIANGKVYRSQEALQLKLADKGLSFGDTVARLAKRHNRKPSASK